MSGTLAVLLFGLLLVVSFWAAEQLRTEPSLQQTILRFGYPGIILVSIIAGLNVIVPFPAASLVPIFTTAGLYLPFIILCLTLGTVIADYIGFRFGRFSSNHVHARYPKLVSTLEHIYTEKQSLVLPTIFIYAACIPFPNEVLLIPLAILGMRFSRILIPLLLGDLLNQFLYAVGIQNVFTWWF